MLGLLTQFGSTSGLGAFGINLDSFLVQLGTFIIAFLVLRQWAFKPILKIMNSRRELIEKGVKLGEQMQKDKVALELKIEEELHKARLKADEIIASAENGARQVVKEAEDQARSKAENIVKDANSKIVQNTNRARKSLEKDLIGLVSEVSSAVIEEKVDAKKDASLIERKLKERLVA